MLSSSRRPFCDQGDLDIPGEVPPVEVEVEVEVAQVAWSEVLLPLLYHDSHKVAMKHQHRVSAMMIQDIDDKTSHKIKTDIILHHGSISTGF